ncbi:hypothetical protein AAEX28_07210 [Lentisphaerota bacterium WC36G]|nr:hypothetical protein LJT99_10075 [Lentisphaerae bacterium WC36]UDQ99306.1 hypothetical protein LJT99_07150 [Lentisphaerae bacterium WC36]UDQ99404.1 hypothetical protein LJT99_07645 [Lentisphaerae bacterium WC36]
MKTYNEVVQEIITKVKAIEIIKDESFDYYNEDGGNYCDITNDDEFSHLNIHVFSEFSELFYPISALISLDIYVTGEFFPEVEVYLSYNFAGGDIQELKATNSEDYQKIILKLDEIIAEYHKNVKILKEQNLIKNEVVK